MESGKLDSMELVNCDYTDATIENVVFIGYKIKSPIFIRTKFINVVFLNCILINPDFSHSSMQVKFTECSLIGANFQGADMKNIILERTKPINEQVAVPITPQQVPQQLSQLVHSSQQLPKPTRLTLAQSFPFNPSHATLVQSQEPTRVTPVTPVQRLVVRTSTPIPPSKPEEELPTNDRQKRIRTLNQRVMGENDGLTESESSDSELMPLRKKRSFPTCDICSVRQRGARDLELHKMLFVNLPFTCAEYVTECPYCHHVFAAKTSTITHLQHALICTKTPLEYKKIIETNISNRDKAKAGED